MTSTASRFMETFARRHASTARLERQHGSAHLCIEQPSTLAALLAYCSGQSANTRIFLRGTTKNHSTSYPSLFREIPDDDQRGERRRRWHAYKHVLSELRKLNGDRWRRKDLGAVLQHYGVRTPWLDVVRNLYTAIWFATHDLSGSGLHGGATPRFVGSCCRSNAVVRNPTLSALASRAWRRESMVEATAVRPASTRR